MRKIYADFATVDPLADITGSPYAYVWNDPVNYTDPSGMMGERVGGEGPGDPKKRSWVRKAWDWFIGNQHHGKIIVGQATSQREPDNSSGELPWYLNKSKYGGKPVLTLGAHNIELPYIERDEYGSNIFENGDTFLKNTVGSMYNGLASTWNEGMAGKEGCSFMYEGDHDIESTVRHIARGNVNAEEIEGIAAAAIFHKVGEFGELKGSGPVPGVLEVSDRVKSVAQFKNYFPKEGTMTEFIFDADSNTFLVGKPHGRQGAASPHQRLVLSLNKKGNYVGGMFKREGNTLITDEYSGHYGHKWNEQIRQQFVNYMEQKTGLKVNHAIWR